MALIHILNHQSDEIIGTLNSDKFEYTIGRRKDTLQNQNTFVFYANAKLKKVNLLEKRNRVIIQDDDGFFREYIILFAEQTKRSEKIVTANGSFTDLIKAKTIDPQTLQGATSQSATEFALFGTEWQPGIIDYTFIRTMEIEEYTNPLEFLNRIASTFGLEIKYRVEVRANKVIGRYVDLRLPGTFQGKEITFGKDLIGITRKEDSSNIVTALLGLGPVREDGTRETVLVEDKEALIRWGRNGQHLIEPYEPQSTNQDMTEDELRQYTSAELEKRIAAIVSYECSAVAIEHIFGHEHEKIRIGHTVRIKDEFYQPPLYLEARIAELESDQINRKILNFKLGNFIEYSQEDLLQQIRSIQKRINERLRNVITATVTSSAGSVFKNGEGYTILTANTFRAGNEVDTVGSLFSYKWTKYDRFGAVVSGWGGNGNDNKFGKSIEVTSSEIVEKATFIVEVVADDASLAVAPFTLSIVNDGQQGQPGEKGEKGDPGEDAIIGILSNESATLGANSSGTVSSYVSAVTTMSVFVGATDDTANWIFSAIAGPGVTGSLVGSTYSVSGLANDSGYVDITASRPGYPSVTKRFTLAKSKQGGAGSSPTTYWLVNDAVAIKKDAAGKLTPSSITVTGKSQTGTGSPTNYSGRFIIAEQDSAGTWSDKYTSAANEATKVYSPSSNTIKAIRVRMYLAGGISTLLDEQIIPLVADGEKGDPGEDAIIGILSNESTTLGANSSGTVSSYTSAVTTMSVFVGATDDSDNWSYAAVAGTGVTGNLSGRTYSVTGLSNDTGYVDITASRAGYPSVTKRYTLSKSKQGGAGSSPTTYWLIIDAVAIKKDAAGVLSPSSITITGKSQTGTAAPVNYSGRFIISEQDSAGVWSDKYTSAANEATKVYSPSGNTIKAVRVRMYLAGGTSTLLDEQIIPLVSDGEKGEKGEPGDSAITGVLSNESATLSANSSGTVSSFTNAETTMSVFNGATDDSANWVFTAVAGAGVTGSLSGRTYTVTGLSTDTGYVDITATKGSVSVTKRFTLSKSKQGSSGSSPTSYWLVNDAVAIKKDVSGALTPSSITVTGKAQTGTATPVNYAGRFIIAEQDSAGVWSNKYTSAANESSKTYTPSGNTILAVRVRMYLAGGVSTLLDEQIIPLVTDGEKGAKGEPGDQGTPGLNLNWTLANVTKDSQGRLWKNAGTHGSWDAQAYTLEKFTNGAFLSFKIPDTTARVMIALNSDPETSASYTSLDYAYYINTTSLMIYESGSSKGSFGTVAAGDIFSIVYDGENVKYYHNGVLDRSVEAPAGLTLSLDTSFANTGTSPHVQDIFFGPVGSKGDQGEQGKPGIHNLAENGDFELDAAGANPKYWLPTSVARVADISGFTSGNGSSRALELDARTSTSSIYAENLLSVYPGQTFFIQAEARYLNTLGTGNGALGFRRYDGSRTGLSNWDVLIRWDDGKATNFVVKTGQYTVPAGCYYLQLYATFGANGETTNKFYVDNIIINQMATEDLIVNGAIKGRHIETGSLSFEHSKGGSLKLGEVYGNGVLEVWADTDNDGSQDQVGRIDSDGAYFPALSSNNIQGNVENVYQDAGGNFYFDFVNGKDDNHGLNWTYPKKNLKVFIDSLPKNLNGLTLQLNIKQDIYGGLNIEGFHNGNLIIASRDPGGYRSKIFGPNRIKKINRGSVQIHDFDLHGDESTVNGTINTVQNADWVFFYGCKVYGNSKALHAFVIENGVGRINACEVYSILDRGLYANTLSRVDMSFCKGKAPVAVLADRGSVVYAYHSRWDGSVVLWDSGTTVGTWFVDLGAAAPPPPPPATEQTLSIAPSTGDNWSTSGYWTNDEVKQGDYGYGARYGLWYVDLSAVKGKTIVSASIIVYRGSGGSSAGRNIHFRTHRYTSRASRPGGAPAMSGAYVRGPIGVGQTATFDITDMIQNNIANGIDTSIGVHITGSTDYMSLGTTPTLTIRYK